MESSARGNAQQNSSVADTHMLVAAVGMGKGLKVRGLMYFRTCFYWIFLQMMTNPNGQSGQNAGCVMVAPPGRAGGPPGQGNMASSTQSTMNKAPSAIKTNIKSAAQIHPYGR